MDVATAAESALLLRPSHTLTRDEKLERRRLQYKLHQRRHRARQIQLSQSLQHYVQRLHQEIAQLEAMRATLLRPRIERSVRRIGGAASHTAIEYLRQFTYGLHGRNAAATEQFVRCVMVTNVGGPDFCGIDELLHQWRLYGQFFHRAQYVPDGVRVIATDNLVVVVIVHVTLVIRASRTGVLCLWPKLRHDEAAIHAMADKEVRVPGTMRFLFDTNGVCTWLGADMDFVAGLQHLLGDLSKVRLCMDDTNMTFDTGQITASLGDSETMAVV